MKRAEKIVLIFVNSLKTAPKMFAVLAAMKHLIACVISMPDALAFGTVDS
jgi:hypothetical protein